MPLTKSNNVASYSLWGCNPKYLIGALENARLIPKIYEGFSTRFFVDNLVPTSIIYQLKDHGAEIIFTNEFGTARNGMFWRFKFLPNDDIVLVRDCDSRPSEREFACYTHWLTTDKNVSTIVDHPYHQEFVLPGLMNFKAQHFLNLYDTLVNVSKNIEYGVDYQAFRDISHIISPQLITYGRDVKILHKRNKLHFVGEVFNADGSNVQAHTDALRHHLDQSESHLYIYHHLGLGDCFDLNAAVRILLDQHNLERVYVFCKRKFEKIISYMYRDNTSIIVLPIDADTYEQEVKNVSTTIGNDPNFLIIGHNNYQAHGGREKELGKACAELFYEQIGIPFERRFTDWKFERDLLEEERVFNKLNPTGEDYIFVHHDPSRGFTIPDKKIFDIYGKSVKLVYNDMSENPLHFFKILEEAKQIHSMESSFKSLIEVLEFKKDVWFHNFRPGASSFLGKTRQNWKEITYANV
jgi:hypothetical protein